MATTTGGTTYVTSTDLVANYPTASLALANRVDVVASGSMSKKTASYTVTVADILAGTTIAMNSASATVITLPSSSLVNGMIVKVFSVNTGAVTFTGGTVTGSTTSITAQYSGLTLTYDSAAAVWWSLPFAGGSAKATVTGTTGSPTITTVGSKTVYKWVGAGSVTIGVTGTLEALLVGGAGAGENGGRGATAGGGGGGMVTYLPSVNVTAGTYTITVGQGAAVASTWNGAQSLREAGGFSLFNGIYAAGGGGAAQSGNIGATGGSTNGKLATGIGQGSAMSTDATGITNSITGSSVLYGAGGQVWSGGSNTPSTGYSRVDGTGTGTGAHGTVILSIG
jgi:hypothetical protein